MSAYCRLLGLFFAVGLQSCFDLFAVDGAATSLTEHGPTFVNPALLESVICCQDLKTNNSSHLKTFYWEIW